MAVTAVLLGTVRAGNTGGRPCRNLGAMDAIERGAPSCADGSMTERLDGGHVAGDAPEPSLIASARAAIRLLTSLVPESGRELALLTILSGLYGAYRHKGEGVPEWLDELMEDVK